jgi:hypothetical protein
VLGVRVMCPAGEREGGVTCSSRRSIQCSRRPIDSFGFYLSHVAYYNQLWLADHRQHESARNRLEESVPETMDERTRRCCSRRRRPGSQGNHRRWEAASIEKNTTRQKSLSLLFLPCLCAVWRPRSLGHATEAEQTSLLTYSRLLCWCTLCEPCIFCKTPTS